MRAESNHTLSPHASKGFAITLTQAIGLIVGLMCLLIGILYIVTLERMNNQTKIKGTATQLSSSQVLALVNLMRQESGIAPLVVHPALEQAATQKAAHMITHGYWEHTDPHSGITPWQFIDASGYRYEKAGENLARDFDDSQQVTEAWMASPPHRANVLEPTYIHTGIGIAYGLRDQQPTVLVVQLLAKPLTRDELESSAEFTSTLIVAPQSTPAILLLFAAGMLFILLGTALYLFTRRHRSQQVSKRSSNNTPPLHLWST